MLPQHATGLPEQGEPATRTGRSDNHCPIRTTSPTQHSVVGIAPRSSAPGGTGKTPLLRKVWFPPAAAAPSYRMYMQPYSPSSGLRTPWPPRLRTCTYAMIVRASRWPRGSWMVRMRTRWRPTSPEGRANRSPGKRDPITASSWRALLRAAVHEEWPAPLRTHTGVRVGLHAAACPAFTARPQSELPRQEDGHRRSPDPSRQDDARR